MAAKKTQKKQAKPNTKSCANNSRWLGACFKIDDHLAKLAELRRAHFGRELDENDGPRDDEDAEFAESLERQIAAIVRYIEA